MTDLDGIAAAFPDLRRTDDAAYVEVTSRHFVRITEDRAGLHLTLSRLADPCEDADTVPDVDVGTGLAGQDAVRVICALVTLL